MACDIVDECCADAVWVGDTAQFEMGPRIGSTVAVEPLPVVEAEAVVDPVVGEDVGSESSSVIARVLFPGPLNCVIPAPDVQQLGLSSQQTSRSLPVKLPQDTIFAA